MQREAAVLVFGGRNMRIERIEVYKIFSMELNTLQRPVYEEVLASQTQGPGSAT